MSAIFWILFFHFDVLSFFLVLFSPASVAVTADMVRFISVIIIIIVFIIIIIIIINVIVIITIVIININYCS